MRTFLLLLTLFVTPCWAQSWEDLYPEPELGRVLDFSAEGEKEFNKDPQNRIIDEVIEYESYWDVIGVGCSFYCGCGVSEHIASSELKPKGNISYKAKNIHDLDYQTAWIEGVPGYGIGEWNLYTFPPENPRITTIIIANGYVKSDKAWRENSRVKALKLFVNEKPYAILHLEDIKREQIFRVAPIGHSDRKDYDALCQKEKITLKFEIADVYPGEKYDDTAISEIYFDGIDVH